MAVATQPPDIWFTADHHFDHANIIKYCHRPFSSTEEMNEIMIQRWNECVLPEDTVYHLGDFALTCWQRCQDIRSRLNGRIVLIKGNHDRHSAAYYVRAGFDKVHKGEICLRLPEIYAGVLVLTHKPLPPIEVTQTLGMVNVHGHCHGKGLQNCGTIDIGVDCRDFRPVSLEYILSQFPYILGYEP